MDFEDMLVSGAPQTIYAPAASLLEYHEQVLRRGQAGAAGIHCLFELYGSAYYRRPADLDMLVDRDHPWNGSLLDVYNLERHCHAAASVVLRIDDAIIADAVVYCRTDEAISILYESYRFPDRAGSPLPRATLSDVPIADFQQTDRTYLYLGSSGSFNYGHWLVDDLPRAKAWLELRRRHGHSCIVVLPRHGQPIDDVRVRSLQTLIDPHIEIRFIARDEPCRLRNLHYVTPVSYHPRTKNPAAIHFLRSRAMACLSEPLDEPQRRLFVARRSSHSRAIINFDELRIFLDARGFEMIEPEGLDFIEQVTLFRDARIVVGQMGAAMTSTLFCRPATNIVYLAPVGWIEPFYLDLAVVGGQQYNLLSGPTVGEAPAYLSSFAVPMDHLYHRLTYMGFTDAAATA